MEKLWDKLERMGVRPERLQLEWISAAEGQKFAKVMREIEEMRKKVTKEEVEFTKKALKDLKFKKEKRQAKLAGDRAKAQKAGVEA